MSWEKVTFHNLYEIESKNGIYKSSEYHGRGTKIINMGELFAYGFIGKQDMRRIEVTTKELINFGVQKGDLLFARRSLVESGAGKSSIVWEIEEPMVFESSLIRVRLNKTLCYPLFYYYWFQSYDGKSEISSLINGVNVKGIKSTALKDIKVVLPTLQVQMEIAHKLYVYDELIENNKNQIKLLEEAAQRLYKEWFVDLHFPGYEDVEIVDGVPKGWKQLVLSEIANVVMGQSPKSEFYNNEKKGLPFHQGVTSYGNRFVNDTVYTTSFTRIAEPGSILFSVRAPVGRLNITKNKIVIGRGLSAMNHKKGYQSYLFYLLKERFFKDNLVGNGSIFDSITKSELLSQKFLVPNEEILIRFNDITKNIDAKIAVIDAEINCLVEARDRLLPKLMSGEIEV